MEELTKQCPFCGQVINAAAIKCKYCGKWLENPQPAQQEGPSETTPPPPPPPQQNWQGQQPNYQQQYTHQQPNYTQQPPQQQYAQQQPPYQQPYYVEEPRKTNGLGITGFILALLSIFLGWIPFLGWLVWLLGLIFSFIGVFKVPRGMAIAGLILSLLGLLVIVLITGGFMEVLKQGIANM